MPPDTAPNAGQDRITDSAADCGHPNHGNPGHDCTPFLPATAWDAPDGTRWVKTPGRDEWTGWQPGEDGCWLYSGDEFRRSYPQWEAAVLAADGAPERVAAIERELRSAVDDVRMTDDRLMWAGRALTSLYTAQRELAEAWGADGPDSLVEAQAISDTREAVQSAIDLLKRGGFK